MLFELVHASRRWPGVAAAVSVHAILLGVVALTPQPPPPTPPLIVDLGPLPLPPPGTRAAGGEPAVGRKPPREKDVKPKPRPETPPIVDQATIPEPEEPTASLDTGSDVSIATTDSLGSDGGGEGSLPDGGNGPGTGSGESDGAEDGMGRDDAGPASSAPIRMTSKVDAPELVTRVEPRYPPIAHRIQVEGEVVLECVIDEEGRVEVRRILESIPLLDSAAVSAVEQWRYRPARVDGRPQAVFLNVRLTFSLGS